MATRIRDRAIRRAGELLKQIEPGQGARDGKRGEGTHTPLTREEVAREAGMSKHQQVQAVRVAIAQRSNREFSGLSRLTTCRIFHRSPHGRYSTISCPLKSKTSSTRVRTSMRFNLKRIDALGSSPRAGERGKPTQNASVLESPSRAHGN